MNGSLLEELPAPPSGRTGWPWTEAGPAAPAVGPAGRLWPKITVVTPSFNQGHFIEETIRSVLLQGYPGLEYLVIDGASTDATVEIVRKYERWITGWVSERDRGQTHAINKGLELATGEIFAYLNSDDLFTPGALFQVAEGFAAKSEAAAIYGRCRYVGEQREELFTRTPEVTGFSDYLRIWDRFAREDFLTQPEVFCRTAAVRAVGGFREDLHSVMDFEMWLRLQAHGYDFQRVDAVLAEFRSYGGQKSAVDPGDELAAVVTEYLADPKSPLTEPERRLYASELREARAHWLIRGAIAAADVGYGMAAKLCWRAARGYPPIVRRYEFWAVLARPARDLVPHSWRSALRRRLQLRRASGRST